MVNSKMLEEEMKKRSISIEEASNAMDMHVSTFYRKIKRDGGRGFTIREIEGISKRMNIPPYVMLEIFFDKELA